MYFCINCTCIYRYFWLIIRFIELLYSNFPQIFANYRPEYLPINMLLVVL